MSDAQTKTCTCPPLNGCEDNDFDEDPFCPVHGYDDDMLGVPAAALSQPTEEIRLEGEAYPRMGGPAYGYLCLKCNEDLGDDLRCRWCNPAETPDVLPVLEGFVYDKTLNRPEQWGDLTRFWSIEVHCGAFKHYQTPVRVVPTEGYRVIREEDAERIVKRLTKDLSETRRAMSNYRSLAIAPGRKRALEELGAAESEVTALIDRLTNTEDQP